MPGMLRKSTAFVPRYQKFESISLHQRVCKLSVPEWWTRRVTDRLANGDPRPLLRELYGSHAGFVNAVTTAANQLVKERFLLHDHSPLHLLQNFRDNTPGQQRGA